MKKLFTLIGSLPRLEVFIRVIYWNFPAVQRFLSKFKGHFFNSKSSSTDSGFSLSDLKTQIIDHGVVAGDILIVHSGTKRFRSNGITEEMLISLLKDIIGPDGTLVLPAIPRYKEAPVGIQWITKDVSDEIWTYDVQRSQPWTGMLPFVLMRTPGSRRGRHPLNTVVATGAHVDTMFKNELSVEGALPSGPESPWAYCWKHNAKILALDVDLAHSLTMIHVAEDCFADSWPVPDWYRDRKFRVIDQGVESLVCVKERHPRWAQHFAERKLSRDLHTQGLAKTSELGGGTLTSIESIGLIDFLGTKRSKGYPYYLWKYAKR